MRELFALLFSSVCTFCTFKVQYQDGDVHRYKQKYILLNDAFQAPLMFPHINTYNLLKTIDIEHLSYLSNTIGIKILFYLLKVFERKK
jgi:hypothetical protein